MLFFGKKKSQLLGVDIGDDAVRAVALTNRKGSLYLQGYGIASLPQELVVDKNIVDTEAVGAIIARLIDNELSTHPKNAAVAIPTVAVISKIIQVNAWLSPAELEAHIRSDYANHIPYPLSEVNLDFYPIAGSFTDSVSHVFQEITNKTDTTKQATDKRSVLLVAARTEQVEQRADALAFAGLTAQVIDVETHTLQRALQHMLVTNIAPSLDSMTNQITQTPFALVQVTDNALTLYVFEGGERIYSREHAWADDVIGAVNHALMFYYASKTQSTTLPISVLFLGGNAIVRYASVSWLAHIQQEIEQQRPDENKTKNHPSTKVMIANPFTNMMCAPHINKQKLYEDAPMLLLAFGLALRSAQ